MKTTAPNSVFALAGPGAGATEDATGEVDEGASPAATWLERARHCFEACGELTVVQLQEALGCTRSRANTTLTDLRGAGTVVQLRKDGMAPVYGLAGTAPPAGGLKAWLQRKGEASAEGKAPTPRKGRAKARSTPKAPRAKPRRTQVATRPAAPASATHAELIPLPKAPQPDLKLGLFSDGSLELQADGQVLRLDAARTRRLIDSLLRFDAMLNTGGLW